MVKGRAATISGKRRPHKVQQITASKEGLSGQVLTLACGHSKLVRGASIAEEFIRSGNAVTWCFEGECGQGR